MKKKKPEQKWFVILLNKTSSHFPSSPAYVKKIDRQTEMTRNIHPVSFTIQIKVAGRPEPIQGNLSDSYWEIGWWCDQHQSYRAIVKLPMQLKITEETEAILWCTPVSGGFLQAGLLQSNVTVTISALPKLTIHWHGCTENVYMKWYLFEVRVLICCEVVKQKTGCSCWQTGT